jgi:hypothetical protein
MAWHVEGTDQFADWYGDLRARDQEAVDRAVGKLEELGPTLGRPYADTIDASRHSNMKKLRAQSGGKPLRVFFAFDPRRTGILPIGGDKTGDDRFYERMVPQADDLFDEYLAER